MSTTATRPARTKEPFRQAETPTLHQRIHAARESFPGLREAKLAVLDLQSEEQSLLAKLKSPPTTEDPHVHDSIRTQLAAVREKIGSAQAAERAVELEASKSAMAEFLPEHAVAAETFVESLAGLITAHDRLLELRNIAMSLRLPLTAKTPFYGADQLAAVRGQLLQVQSLWRQG